jgi:hypothetical protein
MSPIDNSIDCESRLIKGRLLVQIPHSLSLCKYVKKVFLVFFFNDINVNYFYVFMSVLSKSLIVVLLARMKYEH